MRLRFIFLLLTFASASVLAQRYKYKELVPLLDTVSKSEQIALLSEYLAEEPDHANATFRLAKIHYSLFSKSDPLLEYSGAMAHAREASVRLLKAKMIVTASEVRGDNEYYSPFYRTVDSKGRPYVEFPVVQNDLQVSYDSVQKFMANMPAIYVAFTRSVNHYDKAVKAFATISSDYKSMEDIYMLYDPEFDAKLETLKVAYDSSLHYFNQYLELTKAYSLRKYKQKYEVKPVVIYRLDGLITRLSFLTPHVEFWNYAKWVNDLRVTYKTEISGLKEKLAQNEVRLSESLKSIETSNSPAVKLPRPDKDVVFKLNNYDKNSLALALLEYKNFKQHWMFKTKNIARDTTIDHRLLLYSELIQQNRKADSLCAKVKQVINPVSMRKHHLFLEKYYGGEAGLNRFVTEEKTQIDNSFLQYQDVLKANLLAYTKPSETVVKPVKIGTLEIPLTAQKKSVSLLDNTAPLTQKQIRNPDGSQYIAGVHKMNKKTTNIIAFVARINPDGKPAWMKELNFPIDSAGALDCDNYLGDIVSTPEGCAVLVNSVRAADSKSVNTFVFLTAEKGEMKTFPVKESAVPRRLIYQESSNTFVMVFKGGFEAQEYQKEENISFISMNVLGDLLWRRDISMAGTVQEVVPVRDGYIVSGNYTLLKDKNNREFRTKVSQGQSNPYLVKLSSRGDVVSMMPIESPKSIYVESVIKINDGSINLLGYEASFSAMSDPNAAKGSVMHLMTTYNLQKICSNF